MQKRLQQDNQNLHLSTQSVDDSDHDRSNSNHHVLSRSTQTLHYKICRTGYFPYQECNQVMKTHFVGVQRFY